jgi:hypothetical protein
MKEELASQDAQRDYNLAWVAEVYDNDINTLSSTNRITSEKAIDSSSTLPRTIILPTELHPSTPSHNMRLMAVVLRIVIRI